MSFTTSWKVVVLLLCFTTVISTKNTKQKWPTSKRQDPTDSPLFRQEILNLMGLKKRPRPTIPSSFRRVMSAPRYMMKLYHSITQNQSYADGFCCNNTIADSRALGADTIMSYLHPGKKYASFYIKTKQLSIFYQLYVFFSSQRKHFSFIVSTLIGGV